MIDVKKTLNPPVMGSICPHNRKKKNHILWSKSSNLPISTVMVTTTRTHEAN